ncbi:MAG: DUF559 domain-containing protein [Anditalea sp.]
MTYQENLFYGASPEIQRRARELRKNMTYCEKVLWERLKIRNITGSKFRRQHPISKYIVDFYCHQFKLVIEVDGEIHRGKDAIEYDENRSFELEEFGLQVLRFSNKQVSSDLEQVLLTINERIKQFLPP